MIEEMILRLVEQLYSGVSSVCYKGIYFEVRDISGVDLLKGEYINRLAILVPRDIIKEGGVQVAWKSADSHTEAIDMRKKACYRLAEEFVYKVLPKVDFKINAIMHNREVEEILEVLE